MEKLKPCPFCGGEAETAKHHSGVIRAACWHCFVVLTPDAWNRRPSPWIKITPTPKPEAMPEIMKSYFIRYYNKHDIRMVGLAFFNSDRHWAIGNEYVNPTHYMPIPEEN